MAQRNYLINTTTISTTASGTTIGSGNTTSATFAVARTLVRTGIAAGELASGSQTWSVHYVVSAMTTPYEMRLKLQRLNSSGVMQSESGFTTVRSATGTYDDDLTWDSGVWNANDQLALVWEHRRPSGTGSKNGTIDANGASYIDAPTPPLNLPQALADDANNLADTVTIRMGHVISASDSVNNLADGSARVVGATTTANDVLQSLTDALTRLLGYELALADSEAANWADAHQLLLSQFLALSDNTASLNDATSLRLRCYLQFTDSIAFLSPFPEEFLLLLGMDLTAADSIDLADDFTYLLQSPLEFTDSLDLLADSLEIGYGLIVSDPPPVTLPGYRTSNAASGTFATSNPNVSINAEAGDLLILFAFVSGNTNDSPTAEDQADPQGEYDLIGVASVNIGGIEYRLSAFVRTALIESAGTYFLSAITGSNTSRSAHAYAIQGMTQAGLAAIRSSGFQSNQPASTTPAPTFDQSVLIDNIVLVAVGSTDTTTEPPTGWTEHHDTSTTSPALALESASIDNQFTGATITYGATQDTEFASFAVELNTPVLVTGGLLDALDLELGGINITLHCSDTLPALADSVVVRLGHHVADTLDALSDSVSLQGEGLLSFSDILALSDAASRELELQLEAADSLSLTDSLTLGHGLVAADSITLSDAIALGYGLAFVDDSLALDDAYSQQLNEVISALELELDDSLILADSVALGAGLMTADALNLDDWIDLQLGQQLAFSETLDIADAVAPQLHHLFDFSDSFILLDSQSSIVGYHQSFADLLVLADAMLSQLGQLLDFSDSIDNLSDGYEQLAGIELPFNDSFLLTDSLLLGYGLVIDDDADSLLDDILTSAPQGPLRQVGVTDSVDTLVDAVELRLDYLLATADTISLTDSLTLNEGLLTALADSFALTDTAVSTLGHLVPLADSLSLNDAIQLRLAYELVLTDVVVLNDSEAVALGHHLSLSDNAALLADSLAKSLGLTLILTDNALTLTDAVELFGAWLLQFSDTLALTDSLAKFSAGLLALDDSFLLTDNAVVDLRGPDLDATLSDTLTLADAITLTLGDELQLRLVVSDTITLTDHYFDLRHPYTPSARRHIVVPSRARVTTPPARQGVTVPASDRTTRVE